MPDSKEHRLHASLILLCAWPFYAADYVASTGSILTKVPMGLWLPFHSLFTLLYR